MSSESANISNIPDATINTLYKDGEKMWLVLERETNWATAMKNLEIVTDPKYVCNWEV